MFRVLMTLLALACVIFVSACEQGNQPAAVSGNVEPLQSATPQRDPTAFNFVDETTGDITSGIIYPGACEIGASRVQAAYQHPYCAPLIGSLLAQGFQFDAYASKFVDLTITRSLEVVEAQETYLVFRQSSAPNVESAALVTFKKLGGEYTIAQLEKFFTGPNPWDYWEYDADAYTELIGIDEEGTELWLQAFKPTIKRMQSGLALDGTRDPGQLDWKAMIRCVYRSIPFACAGASVKCLFSSEPKLSCVANSCGQAFWRVVGDCVHDVIAG